MRFSFIIIILFFFASCKSDKKEEFIIDSKYLPKNKMVKIVMDIHLADAALSTLQPRYSNADKYSAAQYYNYIFNKYGITKEYFEENVKYYSLHPEVFEEVYDSVQMEISKLQVTQEVFDDY